MYIYIYIYKLSPLAIPYWLLSLVLSIALAYVAIWLASLCLSFVWLGPPRGQEQGQYNALCRAPFDTNIAQDPRLINTNITFICFGNPNPCLRCSRIAAGSLFS